MEKKCETCGVSKPLGEYFEREGHSFQGVKTGAHCKECHAAGLVPNGYGWYGDKYKTPAETVAF